MMRADFPDLLDQHMRRIRASAAAVATEIGMSREAVNNWRRGYSKPSKKHRDKVVACSHYLRLSETECNELLAAVGFEDEYAWHGQVSRREYNHILEQLEQARPYPILMLLSQAHMDQPPQQQLIIEALKNRYPQRLILPVQLPYSTNTSITDFFTFIGTQLKLPEVHDELSFEFALSDLLKTRQITLVISRFEQGNAACRQQLAGILRNLTEMHVGQIQLVLCGGEHLSALKYAQGDLSLLNIATACLLEFKLDHWLQNNLPEAAQVASQQQLSQVLYELIGHHPALASSMARSMKPGMTVAELRSMVINSELLYCDINQVIRNTSPTELAEKLNCLEPGPYRPHLQDPVLRKLFWLNLLRRGPDHQLHWQSEPIRQLGLRLLTEHQT
ncbi:hypothetical protein ACFODZ_01120 [Marinicella sediminis]|uniref:Helix-turn-helix domain-containing protein n=1 Tax=Marinicella sediminis TaxID=1792834 RepID=A0ABV7J458_9GAMM|nr:hypothetical protein [Marinicella sediminis]